MYYRGRTNRLLAAFCLCVATATICTGAETITFTKQVSQPGQSMVQQSFVHMDTVQSYEQSNQVISKENREIRKKQVRLIQTVSASPAVVNVTYTEAHREEGKNRLFAKKKPEPVLNKSYQVTREGEELKVVNANGVAPPSDELEIVKSTMSWVGRPNEMAEFLNGRTIAVKQQIELPEEVAARMFGGKVGIGKIDRAVLTLKKIKTIHGAKCGVFGVDLIGRTVVSPVVEENERLEVEGEISVQADTCRTAVAEVASDVDLTEERGPSGATFTVKNKGKLRIAVNAKFDAG